MVANDLMFIVKENETIDSLGLQDYHVLLQMLRPEVIDNEFAISCVVDIFYYLYLEDVPSINQDAAAIFVARKNYIDWVMQTKEFECLKVKTVNQKDKSLIVAVQIVNAIIDAYLTVIKQYSDEEIQLVNRFTGYKATIFTAPFLQDTDYPHKFLTLELSICKKVIRALEEDRATIIKEIQCFLDELLNVENKLFDNMVVPFSIKS